MWRRTLLGGALVVCACPCQARSSRVVESLGCILVDSEGEKLYPQGTATASATQGFNSSEARLIARSGDRDFDMALAQTLLKLSQALQVSPGFAFYDDHDGYNAYATRLVRLNGADGTVLFGHGFLKKLMRGKESPEVAVAAVCAHEFGHILQFKHNLQAKVRGGDRTVKRTELQADFFSGYFAGLRKKERPGYPAAVGALAQYNVGDNSLNSPQHHGTPQERGAAFVRGYDVAYKESKPLGEAIQISINYASRL
jgi:hypothetical protein